MLKYSKEFQYYILIILILNYRITLYSQKNRYALEYWIFLKIFMFKISLYFARENLRDNALNIMIFKSTSKFILLSNLMIIWFCNL